MNNPSIPPGQQLVAPGKWPNIGEKEPAHSNAPWTLEIAGQVERPTVLSLDELRQLPSVKRIIDIHCVTRWSKLEVEFKGVLLSDLLDRCGLGAEANFISFVSRSSRNHSTSLRMQDALELQTLIALEADGAELGINHGGPIRNIVPGRYFYKSVKWLEKIELLQEDRLGFWEAESGYHNNADPWKEQRYMAPTIDKRTAAKLIESRNFASQDLRSIDASDRDLSGLKANEALLRDANFKRANLTGADFSAANLSNSHFESANLQNSLFQGADLEGANLSGADLRGSDLTGASLIGASFSQQDPEPLAANIDSTTRINLDALTPLTPEQQEFVRNSLSRDPG